VKSSRVFFVFTSTAGQRETEKHRERRSDRERYVLLSACVGIINIWVRIRSSDSVNGARGNRFDYTLVVKSGRSARRASVVVVSNVLFFLITSLHWNFCRQTKILSPKVRLSIRNEINNNLQ